jgi:hypothetical protein
VTFVLHLDLFLFLFITEALFSLSEVELGVFVEEKGSDNSMVC